MTDPTGNWRQISKVFPISALAKIETARKMERFIHEEQCRGKASRKNGWTMSEIVEKARSLFGEEEAEMVRQIIIMQCGLDEPI